jgi:serine/threonine protein kinase
VPDSLAGGSSPSSAGPMLGKYKIVRVIARSNDIVYEAIDPTMNRRLAVKELALSANLSGQQKRERIERFYREAKAAGNLSHPNIVTVYDVGRDGERHFIAMEYLEGPSLRDILRMRSSFSIREALTVALQLTDALGYAHAQGVVHRDVKPDNIHLVLPNDAVKLTDFGIARIMSDPAITSTGQVFGTPSYMSPEQIMSKRVDHRTDIFSLGVLLFEMVVGRKPFSGDSVITITYHIMNSQPSIPSGLPPGVYNIIERALVKDPSQRYQSMASLAADLHSELAFSDSPYHRSIPPGAMTVNDLNTEQTYMPSKDEASYPSYQTRSTPTKGVYAPSTSASEPAAGIDLSHSSMTGVNAPRGVSGDDSTRSAITLVTSVVGVMVLVLVMVFAIAKAYESNKLNAESGNAQMYYDRAQAERLAGNESAATADYTKAYEFAPPGSKLSQYAEQALEPSPSAPLPTGSGDSNSMTIPGIDVPNSAPESSSTPAPASTVPTPTTAVNPADAATYLDKGNTSLNQGNQADAISQFDAAWNADPMGNSGKAAAAQLTQIYNQQASQAIQAGQTKTALDDWQLAIKYSPGDVDAAENINKYTTSDSGSTPAAPTNSGPPASDVPSPSSP